MADQFRADALGVAGGASRTPNLDRLASEGCLFRRAVTNAPECVPARFSLATGLYPHASQVWRNAALTLDPGFPTWIRALAAAGYRTSLFGKTHFHPHGGDLRRREALMQRYGLQCVDEIAGPWASMSTLSHMTAGWESKGLWEPYRRDLAERRASKPYVVRPSPLGFDDYYDVYVGRQACLHLRSAKAPWFCWVSFAGPHEPWDTPEPYDLLYDPAAMTAAVPRPASVGRTKGLLRRAFDSPVHSPCLADQEVRRLRADYAAAVTLIDRQIGDIIAVLESSGAFDRTLIVFTSDHGEMNGDHGLLYKGQFLAAAVDIPLIVRPPLGQRARRGAQVDALVELMDVGATIAEYAGLPPPAGSSARSLRALVEGRAQTHRCAVLSEFDGWRMVDDGRWKAEFAPDGEATMLFDRAADPREEIDLAEDRAAQPVIAGLRSRLAAMQTASARAPAAVTA